MSAGAVAVLVLVVIGVAAFLYATPPATEPPIDTASPPLPEWTSDTRISVAGVQHYKRHDGELKPVVEMDIESGDWTYLKTETKESITVQILGDVLTLPKANTVFIYTENKISPIVTYTKAELEAAKTDINVTHAYLVFPYTMSTKTIRTTNTSLHFERLRFDAGNDHITVTDSITTALSKTKYDFKIVDDEIRIYYDKAEMGKLSSNVTFELHSWSVNNDIISGLTDVGLWSKSSVFQKDSTWYLIAGRYDGGFNGWHWTGSTWTTNSTIISGLTDVGIGSAPAVFQKDSTWYLISGNNDGTWVGWHWTGSTWTTDSTIISGLTDVGSLATLAVFQKDSTWYLISGNNEGTWVGWHWTGSTWTTNSTIISGLGDVGTKSAPAVFQKDSTWYLISGNGDGTWVGWHWTGSTWTTDSTIISGLTDVGVMSVPSVFQMDSTWYLIAGANDGLWDGWNLPAPTIYTPPDPTTLQNTTAEGWVNYTWSAGAGNVTDSYNVLLNAVWTNGSANPYHNSGVGAGNWSNITVYAWNNSAGTLSAGSVSDQNIAPSPAAPAIPPAPTNLANTTGNFWVNHTWSAGAGNVTDSYNVLQNGTWHNSTPYPYYNATLIPPHGYSNITVYAYNSSSTGTLSAGSDTQNVTLSNNPITITNTLHWSGLPGANVNVDYDASDLDSDTPTFSCNRTDLFSDFSVATGTGNWVFSGSTTYVNFGVADGYGSTSNFTMTITEDIAHKPPSPTGIGHTIGNFWVNHTWLAGSGTVTDSYCVLVNAVWHNSTLVPYYNDTYSAHAWQNITVYAWNSSGIGTLSD